MLCKSRGCVAPPSSSSGVRRRTMVVVSIDGLPDGEDKILRQPPTGIPVLVTDRDQEASSMYSQSFTVQNSVRATVPNYAQPQTYKNMD
ncbi:hypothetical protein ABZP36_028902 [Zizania latifolia]